MSFSALDLNTVWFALVGVLFTGYVVLDGFDLGVGVLHLFVAKSDEDRRIFLNAIGPVWDGNEVWLVTGGGALFAAFPNVYATVFSGFYLAFMALLCALIFRAVAIEFRSKHLSPRWRAAWDLGFAGGSFGSTFLLGVAMGNIVWGVPIDARGEYAGSFLGMLHPYALWMGVTTVALFAMHGSIYLALKTDGALHERVRRWINPLIIAFILCYVILTLATLLYVPHVTEAFRREPWFFALVVPVVLAIANIPREVNRGRDFLAFLSSCAAMAGLMAIFGVGNFPYLVYSNPLPEHSLTAFNAASSDKTLGIMLTIALIGIPVVLAYSVCIYWIFRGKVQLHKMSY
ncbi:cytochrome d ubiquinol oxidase subunit II [Opitutus terrae]|uniref:Cytochrome d ubiquinol oxidase, subunit II n=1 Tax=Opitutus terrae (strain DSM 11246 / JCM 15787 / PB90-1) TaxID=452637 RepID=B1ZRX8_OPITP|nr:cytochrome d ubiquinol oxidase subunit II [Opitutus terrae]ACB74732.1 cytochrome d ubiquinol oxidase, subunit II [Opitutus terrae PB90-1]